MPERSDIEHLSEKIRQILSAGLEQADLRVDNSVQTALLHYVTLLSRWNRTYNLTGVRDTVQMVRRHVLDSVVVLPYIRGPCLLDLGTGAGLPGIILALGRPDLQCVLLDSNAKKTRFCLQAVAELGLNNVAVIHSRIEDFASESLFSTIIARAFGSVVDLLGHAGRLCAPGGCLLAMKGMYPVAELEALGPMRENTQVVPLSVPGLAEERHLVIVSAEGQAGWGMAEVSSELM